MIDTTTSLWHEAGAPRADRFDGVSMAVHWATLLLIVGIFATAWMRGSASDGETAAALLSGHRSFGAGPSLRELVRLLWKAAMARTPALPATVGRYQHLIARAN